MGTGDTSSLCFPYSVEIEDRVINEEGRRGFGVLREAGTFSNS